jgi:hypothetical protein
MPAFPKSLGRFAPVFVQMAHSDYIVVGEFVGCDQMPAASMLRPKRKKVEKAGFDAAPRQRVETAGINVRA